MNSEIINIILPKYMAAWLIHESGSSPVKFNKNSVEFLILEQFSISDEALAFKASSDTDAVVPVLIPRFKFKDSSFRFLTESGCKALSQCIKDRFQVAMWNDLHKFGNIGKERKYIILAWMEANGIPDEGSNWDAIEKRYLRQRKSYLDAQRKRKQRSKKK